CGAAERPPSVMAGRAPEGDLPACLGQLPPDGRRIEGTIPRVIEKLRIKEGGCEFHGISLFRCRIQSKN
ncbi:MAG: hypothetical protein P8Y45_11000, partial [Exilibacterium sp.]